MLFRTSFLMPSSSSLLKSAEKEGVRAFSMPLYCSWAQLFSVTFAALFRAVGALERGPLLFVFVIQASGFPSLLPSSRRT
jgi:hypothetical protein